MTDSKTLKRALEKPWFPETLSSGVVYTRTQDDCDGIPTKGQLTVQIDEQGDVWMMAIDSEMNALVSMRWRTYGGGGASLRTRNALLFLAEAIRLDNDEHQQFANRQPL